MGPLQIFSFTCVNFDGRHHIISRNIQTAIDKADLYACTKNTSIKEITYVGDILSIT